MAAVAIEVEPQHLGRLPMRPDGVLMRRMSLRIIHIPLSGGDRKAQAKRIRHPHGLHANFVHGFGADPERGRSQAP